MKSIAVSMEILGQTILYEENESASRWAQKIFKIRPEEIRLTTLIVLLFLCLQAGGGMGDNAASALFLLRFGADFLPYMYLFLGVLNFILALAYAAGLGRFKKDRFFIWLLASLTCLLLVERLILLQPFPVLYPILWLTVSGISLILGTFVWNLASEVCDARQAKRLFPLFTSAGILGSVLGNLITGITAKSLGTENLLLLQSGLLVMVLILTHHITRQYFKPAAKSSKRENLMTDLRIGLDFVRSSSLMKIVAYASILLSILYFGIAFPFNKIVSASFPDEARVAGFLGTFSGLTTAATFLISLFVANRLYARLGIVTSILLLPITYIFGFGFFALNYNLTGAVIARFSQLVMLSGTAESGWNALFNVVPSQKRGQVLAFQNGVPSQIGVALSGILLILGQKVLTTQEIFLMCGLFGALCAALIWRMRTAYGEALVAALRAGRIEVFSTSNSIYIGFKADPFAVSVAVQSLHDPKPSTRRLAAEILGKMGAASAIPALTKSLSDSDPSVQSTVIQALGELHAQEALDKLISRLDDKEQGIRVSALAALARLNQSADADLATKVEKLLDDPNIKARTQAALTLARWGKAERGISALIDLVDSSEFEARLLALETLGQIAESLSANDRKQIDRQRVLAALSDPSPSIRKAACRILEHIGDELAIENLINCLQDTDASVRHAAAHALRNRDLSAQLRVVEALESDDEHLQDSALDVLTPGAAETRTALLNYMGRQAERIHAIRGHLASLADDGQAIRFLRDILHAQLAACERRLIKIVGLFGNPQTMELVQKRLHDRQSEIRAAALETLETLGNKQLTQQILPLLEDSSPSLNHGSSGLPGTLETLLSDPDPWIRALSTRTVSDLDLHTFIPKLKRLEADYHPLVSASARESLIQFGQENPMDTLQTISTLERILLLREVPIFSDLSPEDLKGIAEIAREEWYPDGSILCREGEEGDTMYIIVSGQVCVLKDVNENKKVIAIRGEGDFVGEGAIIESAPRMATMQAQGELRVLVIDGEAFNAILHDRPNVAISVMRTLSRRLRERPV